MSTTKKTRFTNKKKESKKRKKTGFFFSDTMTSLQWENCLGTQKKGRFLDDYGAV